MRKQLHAKSRDLDSERHRVVRGVGPNTATKTSFDNNSYAIVKRELSKSPKMANYIQEVYDANSYHS